MKNCLVTNQFYENVLSDPPSRGADELVVVSGYVSSAFLWMLGHGACEDQIEPLMTGRLCARIIYGMYASDGVTQTDHDKFVNLSSKRIDVKYYNPSRTATVLNCHAKVYVWLKEGVPTDAFCGSLNATSAAFFSEDREAMTACDPKDAYDFVTRIEGLSELASQVSAPLIRAAVPAVLVPSSMSNVGIEDLPYVDLPLTMYGKGAEVNRRSGLNWGVRGRPNPDEAYLAVPATVTRKSFFPARGVQFSVVTDDGTEFFAAICQDGSKALHSVESNAIIGQWFRKRLQVPAGELVTIDHLRTFGRLTVRMYLLPSGKYLMDFRKLSHNQ